MVPIVYFYTVLNTGTKPAVWKIIQSTIFIFQEITAEGIS